MPTTHVLDTPTPTTTPPVPPPRTPDHDRDDGRHDRALTRLLLLAGGHYGELHTHCRPAPHSPPDAVYHLVRGTLHRRDDLDTHHVRQAVDDGLVELRPARPDLDHGTEPRLRRVTLTDAGRGWLVQRRVHGVALLA